MAWFKVDDGFGSGPKVMMIPRAERMACIGAWLLAGTWSAQHLTDGHVPDYMLDELGVDVSQRDRLGTVGLWRETGDGIVFNDWSDYQPMRADVMAKREAERRRKEEYRRKQAGKSGQSPAGTSADADAGQVRDSNHPDPTRPDPTPRKENPHAPTARDHEPHIETAWAHWPKKTDRKKSLEKFVIKARARGVDQLVADIIRFGDAYGRTTEKQFVPALVVWLNGERWTDELPSAPGASPQTGQVPGYEIRDGFRFKDGRPVIGGPQGMTRDQYDQWRERQVRRAG